MKYCVVDNNHQPARKAFTKANTDIYVCPDCSCIMATLISSMLDMSLTAIIQ